MGQAKLYENEARYHELLLASFGERFLSYRKDWKEREKTLIAGDFPLSLDFAINSGCQLSCVMCPLSLKPREKPRFLELSLYKKIISEASEFKLPAMTLGLGSEPLLNPKAPEMIEIAAKAGIMDIRLGTNGALLNPKRTDALINSGLTRLEISVDANDPQTYASIRIGGNFDSLVKKIDYFLERREFYGQKSPLLRLSFLKLPQNLKELPGFLERWKDLADMISIQRPIGFEGFDPFPKDPETQVKLPLNCGQPFQRLGILEDGGMWPCCSFHGKHFLEKQNLQNISVHKAWTLNVMNDLREKLLSEDPPKECFTCFSYYA
jgi:hypothetical protein